MMLETKCFVRVRKRRGEDEQQGMDKWSVFIGQIVDAWHSQQVWISASTVGSGKWWGYALRCFVCTGL